MENPRAHRIAELGAKHRELDQRRRSSAGGAAGRRSPPGRCDSKSERASDSRPTASRERATRACTQWAGPSRPPSVGSRIASTSCSVAALVRQHRSVSVEDRARVRVFDPDAARERVARERGRLVELAFEDREAGVVYAPLPARRRRGAVSRDRIRARAERARARRVAEHEPVGRQVEQEEHRAVAALRLGGDADDLFAEVLALGDVIGPAQRVVQHVERVLQRLRIRGPARQLDGFARDRLRRSCELRTWK